MILKSSRQPCIGYAIAEIRRLTVQGQWRHCPGVLNPADLPSRGVSGEFVNVCFSWMLTAVDS